jgi:hypothetical protein
LQFILQRFDRRDFAENFMLHLAVPDLDARWHSVSAKKLDEKYPRLRIRPPAQMPWGAREVNFIELVGVCRHVCGVNS